MRCLGFKMELDCPAGRYVCARRPETMTLRTRLLSFTIALSSPGLFVGCLFYGNEWCDEQLDDCPSRNDLGSARAEDTKGSGGSGAIESDVTGTGGQSVDIEDPDWDSSSGGSASGGQSSGGAPSAGGSPGSGGKSGDDVERLALRENLFINEVYLTSGSGFVELYNSSEEAIPLDGFSIASGTGSAESPCSLGGATIPAGGFLIAQRSDADCLGGTHCVVSCEFELNEISEVYLLDSHPAAPGIVREQSVEDAAPVLIGRSYQARTDGGNVWNDFVLSPGESNE